jgi:flavin-dependent dehydrogenase
VRRATARGEERTSLDGAAADVLVCGASFAGLAVARELAATGADVLVADRYEIGERQTSACAAPEPWLDAMGIHRARRRRLPAMRFTTPYGSHRCDLPWAWWSFDYRTLCQELWEQCGAARFATAKVETRTADGVLTDRGELRAPLVVDALGWRRVLDSPHHQPPASPLSRGLEVHPHEDPAHRDDELACWIDRSLIRRGYGWSVPAAGEVRVGVGSYDPRDHVREPTVDLARRLDHEAVRYQGNWFPHRLRPAADTRTFFVGDSAGHCIPLSGEGIRTAFHFGVAAGREIAAVLDGRQDRAAALRAYGRFSARHRWAYELAFAVQRAVPAVPPRLLTAALAVLARPAVTRRAFAFYLECAAPWRSPTTSTSATTGRASSPWSSRTGARARS